MKLKGKNIEEELDKMSREEIEILLKDLESKINTRKELLSKLRDLVLAFSDPSIGVFDMNNAHRFIQTKKNDPTYSYFLKNVNLIKPTTDSIMQELPALLDNYEATKKYYETR